MGKRRESRVEKFWEKREGGEEDQQKRSLLGLQLCITMPILYNVGIKPRALSMPGQDSVNCILSLHTASFHGK